MVFWIILLVVVGLLAIVRFAPSDPARWHQNASPAGTETLKRKKGLVWRKEISGDGLSELRALVGVAQATARTSLLAGSVDAGQVTFITRSKLAGFPDYTTMGIYTAPDGTRYLEVYGRLRFGRSDLGVNAKRIKGWVGAAQI
ncbi:MAG: DUF1499 domain-containing protein [Sulfitobacter sp.]